MPQSLGHSCSCIECPSLHTHVVPTAGGAIADLTPRKQRSPSGKPSQRSHITYRCPREANERHFALQAVSCQCDGLKDIT